jgi:cysteine desulfurase
MPRPIYLDYAATTPVDPRVAALMWQYLTPDGMFGNPGSRGHVYGQAAVEAVEQARAQVAALINADPREIVWTSGATESDNLALKGAVRAKASRGQHIVTCKSEHKAVLDVCHSLQQEGYRVSYLDPRPDGLIGPDKVAEVLTDDTVLVSLMHVNNEIGVIQDLAAIGDLTRERGILLHVDAAQSAGKTPIDVEAMNIDLLSVCAHKVYGPKGIGALYVRRRPRVRLEPLLHGGGQERGLRAGTLATHQIAGMGEAFRLAGEALESESRRLWELRRRLLMRLERLPSVRLNGHPEQCVPGILNLGFPGLDAEALLLALDDVALSAGSACSSADQEVSHVLHAIGLDALTAAGSVRISLGRFTTEAEVDHAAARILAEVERLRELSPVWDDLRAAPA